MGGADLEPTSGQPPPGDEGIDWLTPTPVDEDGQVYGPCSIVPSPRPGPVELVIEDDHGTDFSRGILPTPRPTPRGEPLPSIMTGSLSIVIAIVNLMALMGLGPQSIPDLVKRATVLLVAPFEGYGGKTGPGSWYVPEGGFWILATSALTLAAIGILLSRDRGRPLTSLIGFGLNTLALFVGYVCALADYVPQ